MAKKNKDLNTKNSSELKKELGEKEKKLFDTNMEFAQTKNKNVHAGQKIKREIAVLKTFIKQKELKK